MYEEMEKVQSRNACCCSVQNEMSYRWLGRIRTLKLLRLSVIEIIRLRVCENMGLNTLLGSKLKQQESGEIY